MVLTSLRLCFIVWLNTLAVSEQVWTQLFACSIALKCSNGTKVVFKNYARDSDCSLALNYYFFINIVALNLSPSHFCSIHYCIAGSILSRYASKGTHYCINCIVFYFSSSNSCLAYSINLIFIYLLLKHLQKLFNLFEISNIVFTAEISR